MIPVIEKIENLQLLGSQVPLRQTPQEKNNLSLVPALWKKVLASTQGNVSSHVKRYVVITGDLPGHLSPQANYMALLEASCVKEPEADFVRYEIKNQWLAKFTHHGPPQAIGQTAYQVLSEWLPQSGYVLVAPVEIFIYPEGYDRNDPKAQFEYALLVQKDGEKA